MIQLFAMLIGLAGVIGIVALMCMVDGWIMSLFWVWFILPLFPSLPTLDVIHAIGLALMVRALCPKGVGSDQSDKAGKKAEKALSYLLRPAAVLLFGYVAHVIMS